MKKSKISALLLAAIIAVMPNAGCRFNSNSNSGSSNSTASGYAGISNVAVNKTNVKLGETASVNSTDYTLNRVIDSGMVKDDLKYIYLDVTIKNNSDKDYEANGLNNFYLILSDESEVIPNIRADNYAIRSIEGYEHLSSVPAGEEFSGYIGFCVAEDVDSFKVGFFPSGTDINDKSNVIYCDVASGDIISAPEGFIKE